MILNDVQYQNSLHAIEQFQVQLKNISLESSESVSLVRVAIESQLTELLDQVNIYESIRNGSAVIPVVRNLDDLRTILPFFRIAAGLSQDQHAQKLNIDTTTLLRFEIENYRGVSETLLLKSASCLGINIAPLKSEMLSDHFNIDRKLTNELSRRGWLEDCPSEDHLEAIENLLAMAGMGATEYALHRKKGFNGKVSNDSALFIWQARVRLLAERSIIKTSKKIELLDELELQKLVSLSRSADGPIEAVKFLNKFGITVLYVQHLPETYLDGAAMVSSSGQPIIALTLRHDRIDNFWFVLMHELAHILLHFPEVKNGGFFDEFDQGFCSEENNVEQQADQFALETLIPEHKWNLCFSRFFPSVESIRDDAKQLGVHPAIIAGRVRNELKDYSKFNGLLGLGTVRLMFEEECNE